MENETTPTPAPAVAEKGGDEKKKNTKVLIIIAVVVGLGLIWNVLGRFTSERMSERFVERAMERATGGNVDIDLNNGDEGTITISGDEGGTFQYSAGGEVKVPSDWPGDMPIMDGGTVTYSGSMNPTTGEAGAVVMFTTKESVADVTTYYEKALVDNGWTVTSKVNVADATMIAISKEEREAGVYITGGGEETSVTVSING